MSSENTRFSDFSVSVSDFLHPMSWWSQKLTLKMHVTSLPWSPLTLNSCIMLFVAVHFCLVPAGETHDCIKAWKQVLFVPPTGTGVILIAAPLCCWQTLSSMMDGPVWGRVRRAGRLPLCVGAVLPPSILHPSQQVFGRSVHSDGEEQSRENYDDGWRL